MSSMVTYFATNRNTGNFENITSEEYIKLAGNYMSDYCETFNKYPLQTNYIDAYGLFNIYAGYNFTELQEEKIYFAQLYISATNFENVKVLISFKDYVGELSSDGKQKNIMVCLNNIAEFSNVDTEMIIQGYYKNNLLLETKYIFQ